MAKDLTGKRAAEARRRWKQGLPVTLPQLAAAQCITYEQARTVAALPGFPRLGRLIYPADFLAWRKARIAPAPTIQIGRQDSPVDIPGESKSKRGSQGAWPRRAARLRGKAA